MARKFAELYDEMSPERRARVEKRVSGAIAEMPLDKIPKAHNMT